MDGGDGFDYLRATGGSNDFYDISGTGGDKFEGGNGIDTYHIMARNGKGSRPT